VTSFVNIILSLLPAIAFALDMFQQTNNNFGVNEVLLASVLGAVMFSLFAGQPLCIVGVTGAFISDKPCSLRIVKSLNLTFP